MAAKYRQFIQLHVQATTCIFNIFISLCYTFALGACEATQMDIASSSNQPSISSSVEGMHAYILHCTCVCHGAETDGEIWDFKWFEWPN